ncbi:hypothetical protein ACLOJK_004124 [Asimina triloba]
MSPLLSVTIANLATNKSRHFASPLVTGKPICHSFGNEKTHLLLQFVARHLLASERPR